MSARVLATKMIYSLSSVIVVASLVASALILTSPANEPLTGKALTVSSKTISVHDSTVASETSALTVGATKPPSTEVPVNLSVSQISSEKCQTCPPLEPSQTVLCPAYACPAPPNGSPTCPPCPGDALANSSVPCAEIVCPIEPPACDLCPSDSPATDDLCPKYACPTPPHCNPCIETPGVKIMCPMIACPLN